GFVRACKVVPRNACCPARPSPGRAGLSPNAVSDEGACAVSIYMNYNNIKGDVTADGHAGWIELHSFQWGVGRGISSPTGASADRESSAPSVNEITVSKMTDISSTKLLNEAYQGEGQKVEIDFCKTDAGVLEVFMKYTLEDCLISGYSASSGGDRPSES